MRLKAIIFAFSLMFIGSVAVSEASAQRHSRSYIVYQQQQWNHGRHRGWEHKKYTYGYRNYGQYRRMQVGNRRYNTSFWRPSWAERTRTSRYYTRNSRYYTRRD